MASQRRGRKSKPAAQNNAGTPTAPPSVGKGGGDGADIGAYQARIAALESQVKVWNGYGPQIAEVQTAMKAYDGRIAAVEKFCKQLGGVLSGFMNGWNRISTLANLGASNATTKQAPQKPATKTAGA